MQHYISEPLFYACKHKYKSKQIKKQQKQVTNDLLLDQQGIPTTTTLSFLFFPLDGFTTHKLTLLFKA